jgi:carboxyl-terminal processing protease
MIGKHDLNKFKKRIDLWVLSTITCVLVGTQVPKYSYAQRQPVDVTPSPVVFRGTLAGEEAPPEGDYGIYAKSLDEVWAEVQRHFYDKNLRGVDWKAIRMAYEGQVRQAHNNTDFRFLVNRMLGELHASHTEFVTSDDFEYYVLSAVKDQDFVGNAIPQIGATGHPEADGYHILAVLNGGPAANAGIQGGDVVVSADGTPFLSAASLRGKDGRKVNLVIRRGDAPAYVVSVVPVKKNALRAFLDATRESATVLNIGGRRIGYVHLWTMANDVFRNALDALILGKLHNTDGLILDLRDGYGGNPFGFSDVFLRPDLSWEMQGNDGHRSISYTGYDRPMVVLINGGTRSAKEFLTYQFKAAHRATLIGTRTAGAFLGATFIPIGTNGMLELAVQGLLVNGVALENRGVDPDIVVAPAFTYTARDAQLLRAEQLLLKSPAAPNREPTTGGMIHVQ